MADTQYDFLIVGAGLFGSVCARELTDSGYRCLVIDKRNHIGGNCYTEKKSDIDIHKYGPHIFHTNNKPIWDYITKFVDFDVFKYAPKVNYKGKIYSFPINLMTLYQVYGVTTPEEATSKLSEVKVPIEDPQNLEEWILSQVGVEIYEIFIKGYTTKHWARSPKDLPSDIIKRLPIRTSFEDNYYFDKYQGIPTNGYTEIFEKMLAGIDIRLNTDYISNREHFDSLAKTVIYTGPIDQFYDYRFGKVEYRSLKFEEEELPIFDYQGASVINYTDVEVPYTRIIEHKHFSTGKQPTTIITKEYPSSSGDPYYPINDAANNERYKKYKNLAEQETKFIFGGRLAEYKYYDMHQVIGSALSMLKKLLRK